MSLDVLLSRKVDVEHPWLGLENFDESTRSYFFGRDAEAAELLQRLRLHPLLVFYGRSGLGKTSLLRAKLIPELEKLGARPAFYRISYREGENSPLEQLAVTLEAGGSINVPGFALPEDAASRLWLQLHRREHKDCITHLILDQFEEIFTLGGALPGASVEVRQALAILVQGAIPPPVEALLDEGEAFLKHFRLDVPPVPVLLSLRQDYVFALNRWRSHLPQLGQNNFELQALRGPAAFDAVFKPGELRCHYREQVSEETKADTGLPPIVSKETADRIVRFAAKEKEGVPLEEIEVVPPILSLLCRELNMLRLTQPAAVEGRPTTQVTFRKGDTDVETIIATFYERCLAGRREAIRIFIEEKLVSYSGARLQQDEQSILKVFAEGCEIPGAADDRRAEGYGDIGAARACLDELVNQRLLTALGGGENPSYELVHDLVAAVVEKSRTARKERFEKEQADRRAEIERKAKEEAKKKQLEAEAQLARETRLRNRLRIALVGVTVLLFLALGALWFAVQEKGEADKSAWRAKQQSIRADKAAENAESAARQAEDMSREALKEEKLANEAADAAKKSTVLAEERLARAQIEEGRTWIERAKLNAARGDHFAAALMAARALGFAGYGREKIVDPKFNEEYPVLLTTPIDPIDEQEARREINEADLTGYLGLPLWQTPVQREHAGPVSSVAWSPDGKILASGSGDKTVKLWEVASGKLLTTLQGHTEIVLSVAWSPDGKILASGSGDETVKLWEAPSLSDMDLAEYLRSRWIRLAGSEVVWEPNDDLFRDRSFDVVNLRETTLLSIERNGLSGSQKLREQLSLLLRAGNFPEAIAIWKAAPAESADSPSLRLLLAHFAASAADDLLSNTSWRALWLTEQMQSMITSEAMLDPAVSLGILRLDTQLDLAGSVDKQVVADRESFNAHIASIAPRSWFVALGQNLLDIATKTDATEKERQAAVEQLRGLTKLLPDSADLRQQLTEAVEKLHTR